jgi:hypothetical protein
MRQVVQVALVALVARALNTPSLQVEPLALVAAAVVLAETGELGLVQVVLAVLLVITAAGVVLVVAQLQHPATGAMALKGRLLYRMCQRRLRAHSDK